MMEYQITGQLPKLSSDLYPAMEPISLIMLKSVQKNFQAGGRPARWKKLRTGGASHLGGLVNGLQREWGQNYAAVFIDTAAIVYAAIHNSGGTIHHKESFKFQVFEINGHTVFTWHTKEHDIPIPQRMFMMFQEEDKDQILKQVANAIFITKP
jgi:phage gpG-like protein